MRDAREKPSSDFLKFKNIRLKLQRFQELWIEAIPGMVWASTFPGRMGKVTPVRLARREKSYLRETVMFSNDSECEIVELWKQDRRKGLR